MHIGAVKRDIVQGDATDRDLEAPDGAAIPAPVDLSLADANPPQRFIGAGDDDAGRAALNLMHICATQAAAQPVLAVPRPFPMARLLKGGLAGGKVVIAAR